MEATMSALEMTGAIDEHRQLRLDGTLSVYGPMRVRVLILYPLADTDNETGWLGAAARNPAFAFLSEPQEDIYSLDDGEPFHDGTQGAHRSVSHR